METVVVEHLRIYILCLCQHAPLYHPMRILACLTGVSVLVVYLCQWVCTLESDWKDVWKDVFWTVISA